MYRNGLACSDQQCFELKFSILTIQNLSSPKMSMKWSIFQTELEMGKEKDEVSFLGKEKDEVLVGGFPTLGHLLESAMKVLHPLYADD